MSNKVQCANVVSPILINKNKFLAGKFPRVEIPDEIWLSRMSTFITNHIREIKGYGPHDIDIMMAKLNEYKKLAPSDEKQSNAIQVMCKVFGYCPEPKAIRERLLGLSLEYSLEQRHHEFEEVVFLFSIIIHSPVMKFYETL